MYNRALFAVLAASLTTTTLTGCSRGHSDDPAAVTSTDFRPVPITPTRQRSVCEMIPAEDMSRMLGSAVTAQSQRLLGDCIYSGASGVGPRADLRIDFGDGKAAMSGAGFVAGKESGVVDPLAGLGDETIRAGPLVLIRRGEDLVSITVSGVDDGLSTVRAIYAAVDSKLPEPRRAAPPAEAQPSPVTTPAAAAMSAAAALLSQTAPPAAATTSSPVTTPSPATPPAPAALPEGVKPISEIRDLKPGAQCPDAGSAGREFASRAAAARIPLKAGLTLSHLWKGHADDYEHECLTQVAQIDARSVVINNSCPSGPRHVVSRSTRRLCLSDMASSYLYLTGTYDKYPETFAGALQFNLSLASFAALKSSGEFHHAYVNLYDPDWRYFDNYSDETLKSEGAGTFKILINGTAVELPTIEASSASLKHGELIRMKVLDDAAFPLMLDYYIPSMDKFFITYTNISYPTSHDLEQQLSVAKHADVYGIYFDFARASLRSESGPVLQEIATAMQAHPDWELLINGHTDNVGTDPENLELSRQRAQTVRQTLVGRYHIDASRLSTNGFGASQPKEKNDTDRGRALNRRVELIRQ